MKKYSTLLFDIDNTLLNFNEEERVALIKTLKATGLPHSDEIVSTYSEINLQLWKAFERNEVTKDRLKVLRFERLIERFSFTPDISAEKINELYAFNLGEGGIPFSGALELCERLKAEGYELYAVTNGLAQTQKKRLSRLGLDKIFTDVFISEKIGFQKPSAEYFSYVFSHISEKDKSRIILIGDSLTADIKGAAVSGIDSIWINHKGVACCESFSPTYEAGTICDIEAFLQ